MRGIYLLLAKEFADIINGNFIDTGGDGWPASEIRTYLNDDICNSLPADLKNGIIETKTISGHSAKANTNYVSVDKLYLLSTHEVWEDIWTGMGDHFLFDYSYNNTRQLDYYAGQNVTISNYSGAIKEYNGMHNYWMLRSYYAYYEYGYYYYVTYDGSYYDPDGPEFCGISPAFRIG